MNFQLTLRRLVAFGGALLVAAGALGQPGSVSAQALRADLRTALSVQTGTIFAGQTFFYGVTFQNAGNLGVSNVALRLNLTGGAVATGAFAQTAGASDLACAVGNGGSVVSCAAGSLAAGQVKVIEVQVRAPAAAGTVTGSATIDPANVIGESNDVNNRATISTPVAARADLTVDQLTGTATVASFANASYTVRLRNLGPGNAGGRLEVTTQSLPLDFKSAQVVGAAHGYGCRIEQSLAVLGPKLVCSGGVLQPNETLTVRLAASTTQILLPGTGKLVGTAIGGSADNVPGNNTRTFSINY